MSEPVKRETWPPLYRKLNSDGELCAAGIWLPYIASEEDARQHVADFERTRITPGADPRVPACGTNWRALWYFVSKGRAIAEEPNGDGTVWFGAPPVWSARTDRYVPVDVLRWRDPEHRAALTARARAHAAIIPGNRATMPVEVQS